MGQGGRLAPGDSGRPADPFPLDLALAGPRQPEAERRAVARLDASRGDAVALFSLLEDLLRSSDTAVLRGAAELMRDKSPGVSRSHAGGGEPMRVGDMAAGLFNYKLGRSVTSPHTAPPRSPQLKRRGLTQEVGGVARSVT